MTRSAPKRRVSKVRQPVEVGAPVRIEKTDSDDQLGVVKSILTVHGRENVLVETETGEVVTMGERVELVDGVQAKEANQNAERGDND